MSVSSTQNLRMPRLGVPATLAALAALALLWAVASLSWPFGWDQGILAWVGDELLHGHAPYRDAWEMKGPFAYAAYAAAQALFGRNLWGIRLVDATAAILCGLALARVVGRIATPRVGQWTAPLFVLWYASGSYWHTAQPDGWVGMLMAGVALVLLARPAPVRAGPLAVSGALVGLCVLVKPLYAGFALVPVVYAAVLERARLPRLAVIAAVVAAGAALPVVATLVWFWRHGALGDLVDTYLRYPALVYANVASVAIGARARGVVEYALAGRVAVAIVPAALLGVTVIWRRHRPVAAALVCWALVALAAVAAQNRFFQYHWLPLTPPLAVLAAIGFGAVLEPPNGEAAGLGPNAPLRRFALLAFAVAVAHAAVHPLLDVGRWAAYLTGRVSTQTYLEGFGTIPARDVEAANYIRAHTAPDDRVLVFGWNTAIVYMSGRRNASRFGFSMPLFLGEGTPVRERYRREFMDAVRAVPPTYLVVAPQSTLLLGKPYALADFPEFERFVAERYQPVAHFGELTVYRYAGSTPGAL